MNLCLLELLTFNVNIEEQIVLSGNHDLLFEILLPTAEIIRADSIIK